jgi:hypothetical protein
MLHVCMCLQVGYSLNALVDFPPDDPIAIIKHLMVGSEGTLGFISNVTYKCVPQAPHSVSTRVLLIVVVQQGGYVIDHSSDKLCHGRFKS